MPRMLLLLSLMASVVTTLPATADEDRVARRGRDLYRIYCVTCHGERGAGDGPTADLLKVPPTDLTRLSAEADGEFPFDRVYRVVDGRDPVRGHGERSMPIWGLAFQDLNSDHNQEGEVRGRILQLLEYLRTIQAAD